MLHDIAYSFFVALAVSALSSLAKWMWKELKASNSTSESHREPPSHHNKESIKRQFYKWLVLLVITSAVFFAIIGKGAANSYPFLTCFSGIGVFFSIIFTWGAFDVMAELAPDDKPVKHAKDAAAQKPTSRRANDDVDSEDSK